MEDMSFEVPEVRRSYLCPECGERVEIHQTTKISIEENVYSSDIELRFVHPDPIAEDCQNFQRKIIAAEKHILEERLKGIFGRMALDVPHPLPPL